VGGAHRKLEVSRATVGAARSRGSVHSLRTESRYRGCGGGIWRSMGASHRATLASCTMARQGASPDGVVQQVVMSRCGRAGEGQGEGGRGVPGVGEGGGRQKARKDRGGSCTGRGVGRGGEGVRGGVLCVAWWGVCTSLRGREDGCVRSAGGGGWGVVVGHLGRRGGCKEGCVTARAWAGSDRGLVAVGGGDGRADGG